VIKSRRMRWAAHLARIDESRSAYTVSVGKPEKKRYHSEDPGVSGRIILNRPSRREMGAWIGFIWLRIGTGGGLL
jgi:hypothetical protein